jgi:ankyrin repeat protein
LLLEAVTNFQSAPADRHADCVVLLLQHGSLVNIVDRKGQTPLFCAVKNWDTDSCIALLQAGASPDGDRRNLSSPLHIACQDGYAIGVKVHTVIAKIFGENHNSTNAL